MICFFELIDSATTTVHCDRTSLESSELTLTHLPGEEMNASQSTFYARASPRLSRDDPNDHPAVVDTEAEAGA